MKNIKKNKKNINYKINIEDFITHPKDTITKENLSKTIRYNELGESDLNLNKKFNNDDEVCCVKVVKNNNNIYKVKVNRKGELFNPINKSNNYGLNKRDRATNESLFTLKECSKARFDNYVQFLKKRHESLLIKAQRER